MGVGRRAGHAAGERWVPVLVVGALLLLLPLALDSLIIAVAIAAIAMLVPVVGLLGLDRTSLVCLVVAFGLAPCVKFVLPGFRFFDISDVFLILAIVLAVPRLMTRRVWLPLAFGIGSMAFVTISILSSLQSSDPAGSYYYGARVVFAVIVIPALLVWWLPRDKVLVVLVLAFAAGTCISVLSGLTHGGRNAGLTQHPNVLGYTAVLTLSLVPFLAKVLTKPLRSWVCVTVFGIAVVGVMTSGSRAALVVALVLFVLVPAAERSVLAAVGVLGSGLAAVLVLVPQHRAAVTDDGSDALSRLLGAGSVQGSDEARISGVKKVWSLALEHPFLGSGFTFGDFEAHNLYVQVAAAVGFFGLAAFVVVCLSMATSLFAHQHTLSRLAYPAIVFIVAGPVSPNLTDRYIGVLLGLSLIGVVAVHEARREGDPDRPTSGERPPISSRSHRPAVRPDRTASPLRRG